MAGFEVTLHGRIWVTPEDIESKALLVLRIAAAVRFTARR